MKLIKSETIFLIDDNQDYNSLTTGLRRFMQHFADKHEMYIVEGNIEVRAKKDQKKIDEKKLS